MVKRVLFFAQRVAVPLMARHSLPRAQDLSQAQLLKSLPKFWQILLWWSPLQCSGCDADRCSPCCTCLGCSVIAAHLPGYIFISNYLCPRRLSGADKLCRSERRLSNMKRASTKQIARTALHDLFSWQIFLINICCVAPLSQ